VIEKLQSFGYSDRTKPITLYMKELIKEEYEDENNYFENKWQHAFDKYRKLLTWYGIAKNEGKQLSFPDAQKHLKDVITAKLMMLPYDERNYDESGNYILGF